MNRLHSAAAAFALVLLAVPAAQAQSVTCQNAQYSETLLQRFPKIRQHCLDIVNKDGQNYAVIKADLVRTSSDSVTVRVKQPDGTRGEARQIKVKPDFRVLVDQQPTRVSDLAVGQELTAYVKVAEPMIALAPAVPTDPLEPTPLENAEPALAANTPSMPRTAGPMPALGVAGLALVLLGCLASLRRRYF